MYAATASFCLLGRSLLLTLLMCFFSTAGLLAQPDFVWDKTLGGENYEELQALQIVTDGIIVGGSSRSNLEFGDPADTSWNMLVYKLDFDRNVLWRRHFGGDRHDRMWMLISTADGGFLCGGYSYSGIGGDKSEPSRGGMDVWVLRLDAAGNKLWDKTYGGAGRDEMFAALEMPHGGFLLGCHSNSNAGGDKTENSRGDQDFWLLYTDDAGNLLWDQTLGGNGIEQINDLEWAPDGNVYLSGGTTSQPNTGDIAPDFARGGKDFWIGKFNPDTRQLLWNHRYGGTGEDFAYALCVGRDGQLYLGGRSASIPAPPTQYNNGKDSPFYGGDSDYWLLELDDNGQKLREWSFGGTGLDDLYVLLENKRGELVIGGVSDSGISGNKTAPPHGGYDFWLLGLDPAGGAVRWQRTLGAPADDALTKVAQFPDGALVFGGHSASNIGFDKTENAIGLNDFWIISSECGLTAVIAEIGGSGPCSGEPLTLEIQAPDCDSCLFLWSNGATGPSIEVPPGTAGAFSVMTIDLQGCMAGDTIVVDVGQTPQINLGPPDTLIAEGATLTLGGNDPTLQYLWNDGSTGATLVVEDEGLYSVTVTGPGGCTASASIRVSFLKKSAVWVPNVFSPNFDGYNDYLTIYTDNSVQQVVIFQIANRWGEVCFRRDNFLPLYETEGWDGRFRAYHVGPDVYAWTALVEFLDGRKAWFSGDVTLVR